MRRVRQKLCLRGSRYRRIPSASSDLAMARDENRGGTPLMVFGNGPLSLFFGPPPSSQSHESQSKRRDLALDFKVCHRRSTAARTTSSIRSLSLARLADGRPFRGAPPAGGAPMPRRRRDEVVKRRVAGLCTRIPALTAPASPIRPSLALLRRSARRSARRPGVDRVAGAQTAAAGRAHTHAFAPRHAHS